MTRYQLLDHLHYFVCNSADGFNNFIDNCIISKEERLGVETIAGLVTKIQHAVQE